MERKKFYRRDLPHFLPNDEPYFVTFRLADTLPRAVIEERARKALNGNDGMTFTELDGYLDKGLGPLWLKQPDIANTVKEALHYRDGSEYLLHAYTIMPNHIHMVITLDNRLNLFEVLQSLKRHTARQCNILLKRTGAFWQHESYDHVIRDGEFGRIVFYILRNPVKAGLVKSFREWSYYYISSELDGFDETESEQSHISLL
ncbi:MAG TPA: transposase [Candidatus Kapabacteria bacterium]|nr:transposase [Candidatus Kapabacteria bacterium]